MTKKETIFSKTGGRCIYCGRRLDYDTELTLEHFRPRAQGGRDRIENLFPACFECNNLRGSLSIKRFKLKLAGHARFNFFYQDNKNNKRAWYIEKKRELIQNTVKIRKELTQPIKRATRKQKIRYGLGQTRMEK